MWTTGRGHVPALAAVVFGGGGARGAGAQVAGQRWRAVVGRPEAGEAADSVPGRATDYVGLVLQKRVPVSRGGALHETDGTERLYRSILLPMSDDGTTISGLLGAANCREVQGEG